MKKEAFGVLPVAEIAIFVNQKSVNYGFYDVRHIVAAPSLPGIGQE